MLPVKVSLSGAMIEEADPYIPTDPETVKLYSDFLAGYMMTAALTGSLNGVINSSNRAGVPNRGKTIQFGSDTKSAQKLTNQMNQRGWTENSVRNTVNSPYAIRASINKATGNSATVYYTKKGSYIIIDDVTNAIVQVSDNISPSTWIPDTGIIDPYIP